MSTPSFGDLSHFLRNLLLIVVDAVVCAEFAALGQLRLITRSRNHAAMKKFGELNCSYADAGTRAQHQHSLSWTNAGTPDEHVPRRHKHERHARGLIEIERVGNRNHVCRRHRDQFAVASVDAVAEDGKLAAMVLQSGNALLAMAAVVHRRQQHPLPGLESADVLAHLDYFARNVAAKNVRQLYSRQSLAHPDIQMIQRTCPHTHQNLIFAQLRIGDVFVGQNFRSAELMNTDCFHKDVLLFNPA